MATHLSATRLWAFHALHNVQIQSYWFASEFAHVKQGQQRMTGQKLEGLFT